MAIGKEVKTKIASIGSTQKITSAMEMVAASKMRRAQDRMALGKPCAQRIRDVWAILQTQCLNTNISIWKSVKLSVWLM